jgi:hypothetical protein
MASPHYDNIIFLGIAKHMRQPKVKSPYGKILSHSPYCKGDPTGRSIALLFPVKPLDNLSS